MTTSAILRGVLGSFLTKTNDNSSFNGVYSEVYSEEQATKG